MPADTIDTALVTAYKNNIQLKFQQEGSRLRPYVREEAFTGEQLFIDRMLPLEAVEVTTRHANTVYQQPTYDRRRLGQRMFTEVSLIDQFDRVRMLADPQDPTVTTHAYGLGRKLDTIILAAVTGTAYGGKQGTTPVSFTTSTQQISDTYSDTGGSASTSLTIDKCRKAWEILKNSEALNPMFMMGKKPVMVTDPQMVHSMLTYTPVINANYNTVRALVDGELNTFMGFEFIQLASSFFPTVTAGIIAALAWAPEAMAIGILQDIHAMIERLPQKNYSTQVYAELFADAARLWEDGVIQILCNNTAL